MWFCFVSIPPFPPFLLPSLPRRNIVNIYFFVGDLESISDVCALKLNVSIKGKSKPSLALSQLGLGAFAGAEGGHLLGKWVWGFFGGFGFLGVFFFYLFWGILLPEPFPILDF